MRKRWAFRGAKIAAFGLAAVTVAGGVMTGLWNWLMPPIFGLAAISFWQALGLLILSRLLFGSFGGRRGRRMSPEERMRFREGMRQRCQNVQAAETTPRM